jgi:hypothetical protein
MYSTCIFCHRGLGKNESVEQFPIGRRLAFDPARGRLWVVCRNCERWNLTPLEERWEAIEQCERLFTGTKLRVSTAEIGLTRLRDGLELVRIGAPQRPEMAAWRYGDQFGRRRRRHLMQSGVLSIAMLGLYSVGPLAGAVIGGTALFHVVNFSRQIYKHRRARVRLTLPGERTAIALRDEDLSRVWIGPAADGWSVNLSYGAGIGSIVRPARQSFRIVDHREMRIARLTGDDALRAIEQLLPAINASGAGRAAVESAIGMLESAGDRDALFRRWIMPRVDKATLRRRDPSPTLRLSAFPREALLAFEMATHEESERRALEGELSILEAMWRDAEEIAAIADSLLVPAETQRRLDDARRHST